ncbi:MAG: RsmD family RNA methyltransferase [Victivallales bacterium]|nr:RsmD family RNA methyltransferase [Victivallales bacterium]
MKVLSGIASGIVLDVPRGMEIRPTGARARCALFDSLGSSMGWLDKVVVDLFAGSGALGLEAASRGAAIVRFVEKSQKHTSIIKKNIAKIRKAGVSTDIAVVAGNALSPHLILPSLAQKANYIFADPPYADFSYSWSKILSDGNFAEWAGTAVMIWETPPNVKPAPPNGWSVIKRESRGGANFTHVCGH